MSNINCKDLLQELQARWDTAWEGERGSILVRAVRAGCTEAKPFLVKQVDAEDPHYRKEALRGLAELEAREHRELFARIAREDPDDSVRKTALVKLGTLFRNAADPEILRIALGPFDDPDAPSGLRLAAGAVMMYQLGMEHDESGRPAWWDEQNEYELEHPLILKAVERTRRILGVEPKEESG